MNWVGLWVFVSTAAVGVMTWPWGAVILAALYWLWQSGDPKK